MPAAAPPFLGTGTAAAGVGAVGACACTCPRLAAHCQGHRALSR